MVVPCFVMKQTYIGHPQYQLGAGVSDRNYVAIVFSRVQIYYEYVVTQWVTDITYHFSSNPF